jgi:hypothetical protein
MTNYNFHGKRFSDDDIADHFYDEDWSWFKKMMNISTDNHADCEAKVEKWKKGQEAMWEFESMKDNAELRALSKHSLENPLSDKQYDRMMALGKKLGYKK